MKIFLALCGFLFLIGCGTKSGPIAEQTQKTEIEQYRAVSEFSPAIQKAAHAIVKILNEDGSFGTGFFVGPKGRLLTNDHVLGKKVCAKEGCHITLFFDYQRGLLYKEKQVFAKPITGSTSLDAVLLQVYENDSEMNTPQFIDISDGKNIQNSNEKIFIVGHPRGGVKKVSVGKLISKQGEWLKVTNFVQPGSSGSPALNEEGKFLGLLHTRRNSPIGNRAGIASYSHMSSAKALKSMIDSKDLQGFHSVKEETSEKEIEDIQSIYLNHHQKIAKIKLEELPIVEILGNDCDAKLKKKVVGVEGVDQVLNACDAVTTWLNCKENKEAYESCPSDKVKWDKRLKNVVSFAKEHHSESLYGWTLFAAYALESDLKVRIEKAHKASEEFFFKQGNQITPIIAERAILNEIENILDINLINYTRQYKSLPHFEIYWNSIIDSYFTLHYNLEKIPVSELNEFIQSALSSDRIDVENYLTLEGRAYYKGLLK